MSSLYLGKICGRARAVEKGLAEVEGEFGEETEAVEDLVVHRLVLCVGGRGQDWVSWGMGSGSWAGHSFHVLYFFFLSFLLSFTPKPLDHHLGGQPAITSHGIGVAVSSLVSISLLLSSSNTVRSIFSNKQI